LLVLPLGSPDGRTFSAIHSINRSAMAVII
jgi:hypothetical protein